MKKKLRILIVTNVQTKGNPALWFIFDCLKEKYDLVVFGAQETSKADIKSDVKYFVHSYVYSIFVLFKFNVAIKLVLLLLFRFDRYKASQFYKVVLLKIKLYLNQKEFQFKLRGNVDFIINIDTEAAYITNEFSLRNNIPNAYFIYEFYAEQIMEKKDEYYIFRTNIEKIAIKNCNVLLSSCNKLLGDFLLNKYSICKEILDFSVCPIKTYTTLVSKRTHLAFYYHGALFDNRGIQEAIIAMKEVEGAVLYIRGFGYFENELKRIVKENKLHDKAFFLEPVPTESLSEAAKEFDLGLSLVRMNVLNHIYNVGFKVFENISAGLALILPESYPLKKMNDDYHVGFSYKDATVENLVKAFKYCVAHPEKVLEWKQNARIAYENEYNPEKQKKKLIDTIESLVDKNK